MEVLGIGKPHRLESGHTLIPYCRFDSGSLRLDFYLGYYEYL